MTRSIFAVGIRSRWFDRSFIYHTFREIRTDSNFGIVRFNNRTIREKFPRWVSGSFPKGSQKTTPAIFRCLEAGKMHQAEISPDRILPLEHARVRVKNDQVDVIQDAIARLEIERDQLRAEGTTAPEHCWIETGKGEGSAISTGLVAQ